MRPPLYSYVEYIGEVTLLSVDSWPAAHSVAVHESPCSTVGLATVCTISGHYGRFYANNSFMRGPSFGRIQCLMSAAGERVHTQVLPFDKHCGVLVFCFRCIFVRNKTDNEDSPSHNAVSRRAMCEVVMMLATANAP